MKSEYWLNNQEKYCQVGDLEFEEFHKKYKQGRAIIEFDQHFSNRCIERSVNDQDLRDALRFGWVIERNKTAGQISIVLLCYVGKYRRPLHFVFSIINDNKWVAITTYTPLSHSWKWSNDFMTRTCFCSHETECE